MASLARAVDALPRQKKGEFSLTASPIIRVVHAQSSEILLLIAALREHEGPGRTQRGLFRSNDAPPGLVGSAFGSDRGVKWRAGSQTGFRRLSPKQFFKVRFGERARDLAVGIEERGGDLAFLRL